MILIHIYYLILNIRKIYLTVFFLHNTVDFWRKIVYNIISYTRLKGILISMKKLWSKIWDVPERRNMLYFIIMTFVFTGGLYVGGTSHGFISTFPIFFVVAFCVFLFYRDIKSSLLMTTLLSLCLSLADSIGYNSVAEQSPTLNHAIIKVIFFVLTAALAYYAAGKFRSKTKGGYIITVLSLAFYLVCFNAVFGNIFGAVKWHNETREYLTSTYPNQKIETMSTAFNFKTHHYETTITFRETDRNYYGEEKMALEENYDGYFLYAKQAVFEMGKSAMTAAIRESDKQTNFVIESRPFEQKLDRSMFDLGGEYEKLFPYLSYEITIRDDMTDIMMFEEKCTSLVAALNEKFVYHSLKIYGGEKHGLLFESDVDGVNGTIITKPFDKDTYIDEHRLNG